MLPLKAPPPLVVRMDLACDAEEQCSLLEGIASFKATVLSGPVLSVNEWGWGLSDMASTVVLPVQDICCAAGTEVAPCTAALNDFDCGEECAMRSDEDMDICCSTACGEYQACSLDMQQGLDTVKAREVSPAIEPLACRMGPGTDCCASSERSEEEFARVFDELVKVVAYEQGDWQICSSLKVPVLVDEAPVEAGEDPGVVDAGVRRGGEALCRCRYKDDDEAFGSDSDESSDDSDERNDCDWEKATRRRNGSAQPTYRPANIRGGQGKLHELRARVSKGYQDNEHGGGGPSLKKKIKAQRFRRCRFPREKQLLLDEALLDRMLNPKEWLCAFAPEDMKYTHKFTALMKGTGLSAAQVRRYMHNNARKGKKLAGDVMAARLEAEAAAASAEAALRRAEKACKNRKMKKKAGVKAESAQTKKGKAGTGRSAVGDARLMGGGGGVAAVQKRKIGRPPLSSYVDAVQSTAPFMHPQDGEVVLAGCNLEAGKQVESLR